jgi:hypothetical protein
MKKKLKVCVADDFSPAPAEYLLFHGQPEKALARYALAKSCMAVILPLAALAAAYNIALAFVLSGAGGIIGFLLLRKRHETKGALVPLCCFLAGIPIGLFILSPLLAHVRALLEVFYGI